MPTSASIIAGRAVVVISATTTELDKALARAQSQLNSFGAGLAKIGLGFQALGSAIVAPLIAAGKVFASVGDELFQASQRTGIAIEALSELKYVAEQTGIGFRFFELGIRRAQQQIVRAAEGSKSAVETFERLGLTIESLKGLSPDQQFVAIAEALNKIQDPTVKAGLSLEIFGRYAGTKLLQAINLGGAGIDDMRERAKALGLQISTKDAAAAAIFTRAMRDLGDVIANAFFRAGAAVAPVLLRWTRSLVGAVVAVNRFISSHKELFQTALKVGAVLVGIGTALLGVAAGFYAVSAALTPVRTVLALVATLFSGGFSVLTALSGPVGVLAAGLIYLAAVFGWFSGVGQRAFQALRDYFGELLKTAKETVGGVVDALSSGDLPLAVDIAMAGIKLAFAQGIKPLKELWLEFSTFIRVTFENAIDFVAKKILALADKFKQTLAELRRFLEHPLGATTSERDDLTPGDPTGASRDNAKGAADYQRDLYNKQFNQAGQLMNELQKGKINAAQTVAQTEDDLLEKQHQAELKAIADEADAREKATNEDIADKRKRLALLKSIAEIEKVHAPLSKLAPLPPPPGAPDEEDFDRLEKGANLLVAGTFSARGAGGLGVDLVNPAKDTASNTSDIAKQTTIIANVVKQGFGWSF